MWAKTVIWLCLRLRGPNLNSEATFSMYNPPTFCGFHPSAWPKRTPGPECWLPPVHLAPLWETQHGAYPGPFPAISSPIADPQPHFAHSKPHMGSLCARTVNWPYSGLRGSKRNHEGTVPRYTPSRFAVSTPGREFGRALREFGRPIVHLAPLCHVACGLGWDGGVTNYPLPPLGPRALDPSFGSHPSPRPCDAV